MRKRWVAAMLAALTLTACTGKNAVDQGSGQFRYVAGTANGKLIPLAERAAAGTFTLPGLSGGTISLSAQRGKVVVLNYWATWCEPCKIETPQYDGVYRDYRAKGVQFIGIDTKDDQHEAQQFVANNSITYPIAFDPNGQSAQELGKVPVVALPVTVLIDKQGKVAAVYSARLAPADLTPVLDQLIAGR